MTRLTQKDDQGNWSLKGIRWEDFRPGKAITEEMYERLYGALWKLMEYEDTGLDPEEVEILNDSEVSACATMMAVLKNMQQKHSWIPIAERLPEPGMYLVSCDDKMNLVKRMRMRGICFYDHNGIYGGRVYAWMPLPEPYREEENHEEN